MSYLLTIYLIFLIGYALYSAVGIYHLWRFGYVGDLTKPVIVVYCFVSLAVIGFSLFLIAGRNYEFIVSWANHN
ncbi:MAG: hypothetical protein AAB360_04075 [Patescibacteria group bacterium]